MAAGEKDTNPCVQTHTSNRRLFSTQGAMCFGVNTENTLSQMFTLFLNILTIRSDRQTDRCMDERMYRQTDI